MRCSKVFIVNPALRHSTWSKMTMYSSSLIRRQIAHKIALILTLIGYITVSISISKFHMFRYTHQNKVYDCPYYN